VDRRESAGAVVTAGGGILIHAFAENPDVITGALRVARNAAQGLPDRIVEVVVQGPAVTGLTADGGFEDDLAQTLITGVNIVACRNSLDRAGLDPSQLAAGIAVVPSAVVHLAERQWAGAAYIRV
jgi:intracellular sulfur oxidation DsrE/DsrF family protein